MPGLSPRRTPGAGPAGKPANGAENRLGRYLGLRPLRRNAHLFLRPGGVDYMGGIMKKWKIIARHKWVTGATITESHCEEKSGELCYLRFTATIKGFRNFRIYEGFAFENDAAAIVDKVKEILNRIEKGDESVFNENTEIK